MDKQQLYDALYEQIHGRPVYRDARGYHIKEYEDWEGGVGSWVNTYFPEHLQKFAEEINLACEYTAL